MKYLLTYCAVQRVFQGAGDTLLRGLCDRSTLLPTL